MANPRKFSEKIALHNHRQAEETARFEQIMREVSDATAKVERSPSASATNNKNTLRINNLGNFRGGSLPNVSAGVVAATSSPDSAIAATAAAIKSIIQNSSQTNINKVNSHHPRPRHSSNEEAAAAAPAMMSYRPGSRARSQGGPMRRPHDRRLDTSPYSSTTFLSPPHDTSWRRTHSDSDVHQSAMQGMNSDRNDCGNNRGWMMQTMNGPDRNNDGRPRSSCEVPRVPGIHIYPSAHVPGSVQIPISGNNTGSLPDLTNVDFSSPIHASIDQDLDQGSSPYSSSPVNTSPSTLSPTSITQGMRPGGRFHFNQGQPHSNHLLVPRYAPHPSKNIPIDNKNMGGLVDENDFTQMQNAIQGMYQQQCSPTSSSPTLQQQQQQQQTPSGYRSPRPSPQSSPSLGGRHSAPCSPGAPSPLSNEYNIFNQHQATQFQQHFEQLSMLDPPVSSMSYVDQSSGQISQSNHPQSLPEGSAVGSIELTSDPGYYSTSPSQIPYPTAPSSQQTTPNTPNSIPNIILTDFSSASDEISRQELINKHFEHDLFSEESLRESLEPLDFDELQILSDPTLNLISDNVEDGFRLHRS